MPPIPIPVNARSAPSCHALLAKAEAPMPTVNIARHTRIIARRPMRSANGASNNDPTAMPTRPALNNTPSNLPDNCHCADTCGAVKAIAITSKPSSMVSSTHTATALHWKGVIRCSTKRAGVAALCGMRKSCDGDG